MLIGNFRTAYGKMAASASLIFFLLYLSDFFSGSPQRIVINAVIWVSYSCAMYLPKVWWTKKRLIAASIIILAETAAGLILQREIVLLYFLAIAILSAAVRLSLSKSPIPLMAALIIIATLYTQFAHDDLLSFILFALLSVVFYLNIRSRLQRNEMYDLNQRHLAELQEAYEQLQDASETSMQYAVLEERTRIARDIHDAVGHSLTSLIVQMQALRYMIRNDPQQAEQSVEGMLVVARQGLHDIRTSVHSLAGDRSPSGIIPLKALLSRMEATASIQYAFHSELNDEDAGADDYRVLFRVLQEAITNAIRHSRATRMEVDLTRIPGSIVMRIRDNGQLKANDNICEGFGLQMMQARLSERGGKLSYSAVEPHGFEITAHIPAVVPDSPQDEKE